jgi:plasmid stabilization system protein ParE
MALQIIWTINALEDYKKVVDYLSKEWSLSTAEEFIQTVERRTENLTNFPNLGRASTKEPSIRSIILTKHNKLYYRVSGDAIEILNIFDTRQDSPKNKFD